MPRVELDETGRRGGTSQRTKKPGVSYLSDGSSQVDYVLVYDPQKSPGQSQRDVFEDELVSAGFKLECVESAKKRGGLKFVKISAPFNVLSTYAEILRFKMPIKEIFVNQADRQLGRSPAAPSSNPFTRPLVVDTAHESNAARPVPRKHFAVEFSRAKEYLFDIPSVREDFFSAAQRSQIVRYILQRRKFSREDSADSFDFGIDRLLQDSVYLAAYPLHEGSASERDGSARQSLLENWASLRVAFKPQPLDEVRRYFGVKVGLYFAWLGFYTYMLVPASIVGFIGFLYGIVTVHSYDPNLDVCSRFKDLIMCPTCERGCGYWKLEENCKQTLLSYLFDNWAVVLFSVFIAIWSAAFLELWKRYASRITYQWDLTGFDALEEVPRTEYIADWVLTERRKKAQAGKPDYFRWAAFWKRKLPYTYYSFSLILLCIFLCMVTGLAVVMYKVGHGLVASLFDGAGFSSQLMVNLGAAFLNLASIIAFSSVYTKLAIKLTDLEMPRTQTEYDDSLTLKMFLLKFISCFAWLIYVVVYKGPLEGLPTKYNSVLRDYQRSACGTSGCTQEIATGLAVLMVGQQIFAAIFEPFLPHIRKYLTPKGEVSESRTDSSSSETGGFSDPVEKLKAHGGCSDDDKPWERDLCLADLGPNGVFYENLELALQYGYVTLFVTAFPLAPIFALINNVFEIRIHAGRLLLHNQRPVGQRVKDIGMWFSIMDAMSKLAVVTNAGILAFTSEFIPRLYYSYKFNPKRNLVGYANFTLSYFDTRHADPSSDYGNKELLGSEKYCRYRDFRAPPWEGKRAYKRTMVYWEILAWRLIFIILFENLILILTTMIRWLIPDVPRSIQTRVREDNRITNELIIQHELERRQLARGTRIALPRERTETFTSTNESLWHSKEHPKAKETF